MNREKSKILNYQVIIYLDGVKGSNKPCFTAHCPTLEIADSGKTIKEAFENVKNLIKFHLECLKKEKALIPEESSEEGLITTAKVSVSI